MPVENIGSIYQTKIAGLADAADIQAAFYAYHYGAYTSVATTAGIITPSIAQIFKDLETDIATLEARPSSGGAATSAEPLVANFSGSTSIPNGYIWVDADAATTSSVIGATAVYNNNAPTSNLTAGVIWIDKDASTSTTGNPFIPQNLINAKGDLLAGSTSDTVVVLTVGSDGQYLKADSSTTSGLAWSAPGDLTAVSSSTGITVTNGAGPIPSIAVDTTLVATTSNTMTLSNKTLTNPILIAPEERLTVSATTSTGTINFNLDTAGTLYHTANAAANHTLNFRFSANTSLNDVLTTNDSITAVFMNTNGATAYYPSLLTVDGATSGVSIKYQGGTAFSAGNASSVDAYVYNIIKTAATSYTVLAAQTKFA